MKARNLVRAFLRIAWHEADAVRTAAEVRSAHILGRLRNPHQVIASKPAGGITLGPKVVLFLHWDRDGRVRETLFDYISQLAESGRSVVFVTNAGRIEPVTEERLLTFCAGILIRRNVGYDFGGWRDAIDTLGLPHAGTEEIIIANDSVFGPFCPLEPTLSRFDYSEADVWGLTESWQHRYHLQSYFVAFGPHAIRSPAFHEFWSHVIPAPSKAYIIRRYEVGLTQTLLEAGLRLSAVWPYDMLIKQVRHMEAINKENSDQADLNRWEQTSQLQAAIARRKPLNPTSDLWRYLLLSDYPFIKRELLRDNPTRVKDIEDWKMVLGANIGMENDRLIL